MRTTSWRCWARITGLCGALLGFWLQTAPAQRNVLRVEAPPRVTIRSGGEADVTLRVKLQPGYHVNSHQPSDEFLIPLKLTWEGPLKPVATRFPEPKQESYGFADKPLSVFTGDFDIVVRFRAPGGKSGQEAAMKGTLRYQACTDKLCLPPRTVDVRFAVKFQ